MSQLSEKHMSKTKFAKLPNTNSHAPPYSTQKHVNHPQHMYHTLHHLLSLATLFQGTCKNCPLKVPKATFFDCR